MTLPTVSVIIPTYNRVQYLQECLEAIERQRFHDFELIVVDDGSTDGTKEYLQNYPHPIVGIHQENQGVSAARNKGISVACGTYLAFCDSDDLWQPQKLGRQMAFFRAHPDAVVCYTDEIWIRKGVRVNPCKHHQKISGDIFEKCLELCIVSPSSVMMHRRFFDVVGLFDVAFPACEDYDLWLRASLHFPFHYLDEPLIIKRGGHEDQLSHKYWGMDRFRVQSILQCLALPLPQEKRNAALAMLRKKCTILAQGAEKRNKPDEAEYYRQIVDCYE